jgi:hypothetical protein
MVEIPPEHRSAIRRIQSLLSQMNNPWAITGSLGQALQGVPLTPHDIDLQTTQAGAYEIEQLLHPYVTEPVREKVGAVLRSYFGRLVLEGVQVEVMGDIQKALPGGGWDAPPVLEEVITRADLEGYQLPVLSLDYEIDAYRKMGRLERAALLERWQQDQNTRDNPE